MNRRDFLATGFASLAPFAAHGQVSNDPGNDPSTEFGVGVILIGASWCSVCKSAAPVLAAMAEPAGIPVLVASHDGRPIAPFPTIVDATTHPIAASITQWPTTLIYSQRKGSVTGQIVGYKNARHYAQSITIAVKAAMRG